MPLAPKKRGLQLWGVLAADFRHQDHGLVGALGNHDYREAYGVEPICRVLPIAPSTYHDPVAKRRDPSRLPDRARRDAALKIEIERVFEENFGVHGVCN